MDYKKTTVYHYLSYLEIYLKGDLNSFHDVCNSCEHKERIENHTDGPTGPNMTSSLGSTTTETTKNQIGSNVGVSDSFGDSGTSGNPPFDPNTIPKYFRSTIPHTLTLFSTIDIVGYLIGTGQEGENENNIKQFFDNSVTDPELNVLINVFRHGMTHGYFPKLDVGISYHSTNPKGKLFLKKTGNLILNVNTLEDLVLDRMIKIKENENQYTNMEIQFLKLINKYEQGKPRNYIEILRGLIT